MIGFPARLAALVLCLPLGAGCGTVKRVQEKVTPKASILGVTIVEITPERMTVRVEVKTDHVDLLLGFVKLKYKIVLKEAAAEHEDLNVGKKELAELRDSGLVFQVAIPLDKSKSPPTKIGYAIQGALVVKVIAEIADIPFTFQGEFALKP